MTKVNQACPMTAEDKDKRFGSEACSNALMKEEGRRVGVVFYSVQCISV